MRVPNHTVGQRLTTEQVETPLFLMTLLDQGAVISGPGSDVHDSYFFQESGAYIYAIVPIPGKPEFYRFPLTLNGFVKMLCHACFHSQSYGQKLPETGTPIAIDTVVHRTDGSLHIAKTVLRTIAAIKTVEGEFTLPDIMQTLYQQGLSIEREKVRQALYHLQRTGLPLKPLSGYQGRGGIARWKVEERP